jgi:hypothetical protein
MILLGLTLPAISGARANTRLTQSASTLRQNFLATTRYCDESQEVYPISDARLGSAVIEWYKPLISGGYLASADEADPVGMAKLHFITYAISFACMYPPSGMQPGQVIPIDIAACSPIRISQVVFPAQKGIIYQWHSTVRPDTTFWCCGFDAAPGPIAFADGSTTVARWTDLKYREDGYMEYWCGAPVASTWGGVQGVDR